MAIATNDTIQKRGSQFSLVAGGAAVADTAFSAASALYAPADTDDAPDAEIVITFTPGAALAADQVIHIFIRPMNIDGTSDAPVPSGSYPHDDYGRFKCEAVATAQTLFTRIRNMPAQCEIYLENTSGQTIGAGWNLKITPLTLGPHG